MGKRYVLKTVTLLVISATLCACNLPLAQPAEATPAEGESGGIPSGVLTQAAATIHAQLEGTSAAFVPEVPKPTTLEPQNAPPVLFTVTMPAAPVDPSTKTPTNTLPPTATLAPTSTQIPSSPTPTNTLSSYTPFPTAARELRSGTFFYVDNVHIHWCAGVPWANLMIFNAGVNTIESLSLYIKNVSTGVSIYGPSTRNTPFLTTDKSCSAGSISQLVSMATLFTGAPLGTAVKRGQTLRAVLKVCSGDGLSGVCLQKTFDFVIP